MKISGNNPSRLLAEKFPFSPTDGQIRFFHKMDSFLDTDSEKSTGCFILKGYAGTGKTTLISSVIGILRYIGMKSVLLAPTGRAAKVMSGYSRKSALTIHKKIYKQTADPQSGTLQFERQRNYHDHTLFVVDEASMISDDHEMGGRSLLADLADYVFENKGNKLMLVGDIAQLPPVGKLLSPALEKAGMEQLLDMTVMVEELTEVMRQEAASGILFNATLLRDQLRNTHPAIQIVTRNFKDIYRMTGDRLEDGLNYAYNKYGQENVIIVTRSNKAAVQYNQFIRRSVNYCEEELDMGDRLMVVRNNYTVLEESAPAGFIANGDFVEVLRIKRIREMHGFRFADVTLKLSDYDTQPEFETKIILETLTSSSPALSQEENHKLYQSVSEDYADIRTKKDRSEAIRKDPYLNALQVKFAYAVTCHKSQGGQWPAVFIDQGFLTADQVNTEFIRWLYTAVTRASREVFLMNFHPDFFAGGRIPEED